MSETTGLGEHAPAAASRRAAVGRTPDLSLFLDTNTYLSFYKLSNDDVGELEKLAGAVKSGRTRLYLPEQVRDEFERNRGSTIAESIKIVEGARLPASYPRIFTNLDGYESLRKSLQDFERLRSELVAEARRLAAGRDLPADRLIAELFDLAIPIERSPEILAAAQRRHAVGNPPGKKDSIGDAVNWESLIGGVHDGEDLILVSADSDYSSRLDQTLLDEFLSAEWSQRKASSASLQPGLSSLFRTFYPHIRIAADFEKEVAIDRLISSPNFRGTHLAIQGLGNFVDFTPEQAQSIVDAARFNSQVGGILGDTDVHQFYTDILDRHADRIRPDDVQWLRAELGRSQ